MHNFELLTCTLLSLAIYVLSRAISPSTLDRRENDSDHRRLIAQPRDRAVNHIIWSCFPLISHA